MSGVKRIKSMMVRNVSIIHHGPDAYRQPMYMVRYLRGNQSNWVIFHSHDVE